VLAVLSETEVIERFSPVRLKLDYRDSLLMGHKEISSGVKKAHGIDRVWELDFSNELFISSPEPEHACRIAGYQQVNEFVVIVASERAVVLTLFLLLYIEEDFSFSEHAIHLEHCVIVPFKYF